MEDNDLLSRITVNPMVLAGKPVIAGTRLSVEYIINLLAHGDTIESIINEYRTLSVEDIQACLLFASKMLQDTTFMPLKTEAA